jgi:hypothetical protein
MATTICGERYARRALNLEDCPELARRASAI